MNDKSFVVVAVSCLLLLMGAPAFNGPYESAVVISSPVSSQQVAVADSLQPSDKAAIDCKNVPIGVGGDSQTAAAKEAGDCANVSMVKNK